MPLYEYKCRECGHQFEKLISISAAGDAQVCPKCGANSCERQYSVFASNTRKGSTAGKTMDNCGSCSSSGRFT